MPAQTTDPVELLIQAGAIPANPFGPNSRYQRVAMGLFRRPGSERGVAYVLRRFIAQRRDIQVAGEHLVAGGERPDTVAAQALGDPELYWRVADANAVIDPFDLTDEIGARVVIPVAG